MHEVEEIFPVSIIAFPEFNEFISFDKFQNCWEPNVFKLFWFIKNQKINKIDLIFEYFRLTFLFKCNRSFLV